MNPFEQNLERLLKDAYQPESPDPAFVVELQERLRAGAEERAKLQVREQRENRLNWRLGWVFAAAIIGALVMLFVHASQRGPTGSVSPLMIIPPSDSDTGAPQYQTPLPEAPSSKSGILTAGETLRTEKGQRRRVELPDQSIVFVNDDSAIRLESSRHLVLDRGEVFVEVAPKSGERFIVQTPDKQVVALGTRFAVRTADGKTSVAVTQGKVKVSGLESVLYAGQQLMPDDRQPRPAPRIAELIDWTRDLINDAAARLVPASPYIGGKLVAFDSSGQEARISLRRYHIDVYIEDGFARTTIDQTYFNHEWSQLEGTFFFPLPPDASISRLAMYVNGELMEGGMAERDRARDVFEQIRYTRRDPALLEWLDGSTFKMRVFPLESRQEKRIILSYTQRLQVLDGKSTYRFPAGHDLRVVDSWSTQIHVANAAGVTWSSPTHALQSRMDGSTLNLSASAAHQTLDRDLQLNLKEPDKSPARIGLAALDDDRYVMLRYRPSIPDAALPRDANASQHHVILFEASGDRDPLLARTQIEVVRAALENLEHSDTFQIVTAGTRPRLLTDKPLTAMPENIKSAIEALGKVHLIGALDLEAGLEAVRPLLKDRDNSWLIDVGSGIPALGQRREDELAKLIPPGVHYAGIGVGKRWGRGFMRSAAARTGGNYTQINPDEAIAWRTMEFMSSLRLPRLQDIKVADESGRNWLLADASVGSGEELCASVRFAKSEPMPKQVTIRGALNGKEFEQKIAIEPIVREEPSWWKPFFHFEKSAPTARPSVEAGAIVNRTAGYIPRTWGKLEIDRLVAENSEGNRQKIVDLSKSLYVMSPFTSLLVLENAEMYQRFKIDRGRKDHWALYDCPAHIPVHTEPASPAEPAVTAKSRSSKDVLQSIIIRNARHIWSPGGSAGQAVTAWDVFGDKNFSNFLNSYYRYPGVTGMAAAKSDDSRSEFPAWAESFPRGRSAFNGLDVPDRDEPNVPLPLWNHQQWELIQLQDLIRQVDAIMKGEKIEQTKSDFGNFFSAIEFTMYRQQRDLAPEIIARRGIVDGDGSIQSGAGTANSLSRQVSEVMANIQGRGATVPNSWGQPYWQQSPQPWIRPGMPTMQFNGAQSFTGAMGTFSGSIRGQQGFGGLGGGGGFGIGSGGLGGGGGSLSGGAGGGLSGGISGGIGGGISGGGAPSRRPQAEHILRARGATDRLPELGGIIIPKTNTRDFATIPEVKQRISANNGLSPIGQIRIPGTIVHSSPQTQPSRWPLDQASLDKLFLEGPARPGMIDPSWLLSQATYQTVDWGMLCADLVAFAPGLETSWADIEAVLEAEATDIPAPKMGRIDDAARKLVEQARHTDWRTRVVFGDKSNSGFTVTYDGAGRFVLTRLLPTGLRELIVNDGATLRHLYPEISVGAQRPMARAYRMEFAGVLPGALPPVEDLARGLDVISIDKSTIALRRTGKPAAKFEARLIFGDDHRLVERQLVETATGKALHSEKFEKIAPAPAPDLKPDVSKIVVLPLPYRTLEWAEAHVNAEPKNGAAKDDVKYSLLAARFACCRGEVFQLHHFIYERLIRDLQSPYSQPGLLVLARSAGEIEFWSAAGMFDEKANPPLVQYIKSLGNPDKRVPLPNNIGLLPNLDRLHNLWWTWDKLFFGKTRSNREAVIDETRGFVTQHRQDEFGWLSALVADGEHSQTFSERQSISDNWRLLAADPVLGNFARNRQMISLFNGVELAQARAVFNDICQHAAGSGMPLLTDIVKKLPPSADGLTWQMRLARTAGELAKLGHGGEVLMIAEQAVALDGPAAGREVYTEIAPHLNRFSLPMRFAVAIFLAQLGDQKLAEEQVRELLKNPDVAKVSIVWRVAAELAPERGLGRKLACLERALDLEFEAMSDVVDVAQVRIDYDSLLSGYAKWIDACRLAGVEPPSDLASRTIKFGDRWRSLDPDPTLACQEVSRILRKLDYTDEAWEYLTTPIAQIPGESKPFRALATELDSAGDPSLAERALAAAFSAEPTDAQLLWDRAMLFRRIGRSDDAARVLRQLANGDWQPRFDGIKRQAQWMLNQ